MKNLSIFLLISLLSFSSFAQKADDFKFSHDKYDFGALSEGDAASHSFEFTNVGKDTIKLEASDVRASCGCTTPEWTKTAILPGQTGNIKALYNTQGRPGPFTKTITVMNKGNVMKVVQIKGVVFSKETATPESIKADSIAKANPKAAKEALDKTPHLTIEGKAEHQYGKIERNQKIAHDFKVKNTGKSTLDVIKGQSGCNCAFYKLYDKKGGTAIEKLEPGKTAVLEVTYGPFNDGENVDKLIISTNDDSNPRTVITLSANVVESLQQKSPLIEEKSNVPFGK
ncbi:MAG TPA: DUF1573 domain-containing protein [Cytophagaceae bacterium]|jgi:hypothetical protein|nr:DUF1573 domain-containing protein [Cytophagaceae bacterium]